MPTHPAAAASLGRQPEAAHPVEVSGRVDDKLASVLSPHSFEADQYRVLRQFVDAARATRPLKVVAITSAAAGDGKTTTAVNLAITLAQSQDSRVLLVDADLRRPLVAAALGLDPAGPGLAEGVLRGGDLDAIVRATPFNVSVVTAGQPSPNAYQVLESPRMAQLLDQARYAYDYVVLDTPPALLVPDCTLMARQVDGFLIVVAAHRTPRKLLAETLNAIEPDKVLGLVLNRDDRPLGGYYKQYYGRYYHAQAPAHRSGWWSSWAAGRGGHRR
jgi:capsular exopolysaccharide synthesis family protein